jgi:hypothetical protein
MVWLFQICEEYLKVVTALLRFLEMAVNMRPEKAGVLNWG